MLVTSEGCELYLLTPTAFGFREGEELAFAEVQEVRLGGGEFGKVQMVRWRGGGRGAGGAQLALAGWRLVVGGWSARTLVCRCRGCGAGSWWAVWVAQGPYH